MHREPTPFAFGVSAAAATMLTMRPGIQSSDWATSFVGAALTAAATGIVASTMLFLKERYFLPVTIVASAAVWFLVTALLMLISADWFGPVSMKMSIAWPIGAATAL